MVHSSGWKLRSEDETSALRALISLASRNRLATQNRQYVGNRALDIARSQLDRRAVARPIRCPCPDFGSERGALNRSHGYDASHDR
jgi:hypothetical protein